MSGLSLRSQLKVPAARTLGMLVCGVIATPLQGKSLWRDNGTDQGCLLGVERQEPLWRLPAVAGGLGGEDLLRNTRVGHAMLARLMENVRIGAYKCPVP